MIHFGVIIYVCNASLYLWVGVFFDIQYIFFLSIRVILLLLWVLLGFVESVLNV